MPQANFAVKVLPPIQVRDHLKAAVRELKVVDQVAAPVVQERKAADPVVVQERKAVDKVAVREPKAVVDQVVPEPKVADRVAVQEPRVADKVVDPVVLEPKVVGRVVDPVAKVDFRVAVRMQRWLLTY